MQSMILQWVSKSWTVVNRWQIFSTSLLRRLIKHTITSGCETKVFLYTTSCLNETGLSAYFIPVWGAYGYTEYLNQTAHYELASVFILLLLAYVVVAVALRGGAIGRLSVLSMLAALFGITAAAAYFNWTGDYQPQGRYLMVYLPILGTLIALYWRNLSVFWLSILSMMPFVLGLYSFYAIALLEIPK